MEISLNCLWWWMDGWLHLSLTQLNKCTLHEWIVWYVNHISIKLLKNKSSHKLLLLPPISSTRIEIIFLNTIFNVLLSCQVKLFQVNKDVINSANIHCMPTILGSDKYIHTLFLPFQILTPLSAFKAYLHDFPIGLLRNRDPLLYTNDLDCGLLSPVPPLYYCSRWTTPFLSKITDQPNAPALLEKRQWLKFTLWACSCYFT